MKVRIIKSHGWYYDKVGDIFDVTPLEYSSSMNIWIYKCTNDELKREYCFIQKDYCEEIPEFKLIDSGRRFFIGEHDNFELLSPLQAQFKSARIILCRFKDEFKLERCGYKGSCPSCDGTFEMCRYLGNQERFGGFQRSEEQSNNIVDCTIIGPNAFCDECRHLDYTEEEQNKYKYNTNGYISKDHFCRKYFEILKHENHHPQILRCKECLDEEI